MDTRDFIKVSVSCLGLRRTSRQSTSSSRIHQQQKQQQAGYCEIKLPGFRVQKARVPLVEDGEPPRSVAASFYLDQHALGKLVASPVSCFVVGASLPCLEIVLFMGGGDEDMAVVGLLKVPISSDWWAAPEVVHEGWLRVKQAAGWEMHAVVKVDVDPRYVLQFDRDVALSPRVVQVAGDGRTQQPVFSCKFSRERLLRSSRSALSASGGDHTPGRIWETSSTTNSERKGWLVTIHDLSGSPVAAASMVTPFVPSCPGSDQVGRSNPGVWLILVPEQEARGNQRQYNPSCCCWKPWGRLEAWREYSGLVGLRLHIFAADGGGETVLVTEATMSSRKRGEFAIDTGQRRRRRSLDVSPPPPPSPQSSGDCSVYLGPMVPNADDGLVMRCEMAAPRRRRGSGGGNRSKTAVQLSARHIGCVEEAAVFVALAAAVDLCRDACQPFSRRLRKELCGREL